jgi:3-hydroxymyristoyl/3-hydroxydecanoyl-(acyl carrier protein) dehydratase
MEKSAGQKLRLKEVKKARFTAPVLPEQKISADAVITVSPSSVSGKFSFTTRENGTVKKISSISLCAETESA